MSFILDALKKSELERKRQAGPTLATATAVPRRANPPWLVLAIGLLLALNLVGLLAFWIWRETRPADPATVASPGAMAPTAAPEPAAAPTARVVRPLAAEAAAPQPLELLPETAPSAPEPEWLPAESVAAVAPSLPAASRPNEGTDLSGVPRLEQLGAEVTAGLPELNLDLHVYQPEAARRFVFINGIRYTEGMALKDGPIVERITRDGAVLSHRGARFLIERP